MIPTWFIWLVVGAVLMWFARELFEDWRAGLWHRDQPPQLDIRSALERDRRLVQLSREQRVLDAERRVLEKQDRVN